MTLQRWPLAWRLAALPVAVALVTGGIAFVVARHALLEPLETRAQQRVEQAAALMADQVGRTLSRRVSEMRLVVRSSALATSTSEHADAIALAALLDASPAYQWIAIVDVDGRILAASDGPPGDRSIADWTSFAGADAPVVVAASARTMTGPQALADVLVRIDDAQGRASRWIAAQLSRSHADALRNLVLGPPDARRTLEVQLVDASNRVLLGPPGDPSTLSFANSATVFASTRPIQELSIDPALGWRTVATQQRTAALALARDLEQRLLVTLLATASLLALAGGWMSRRLTRPYDRLLDAVSRRLDDPARQGPADFNRALDALGAGLRDEPADDGSPLAAIARDAERLRSLIDGMPLATVVTDVDGRVKLWTRGAESLFGHSAAAAVGRPLRDLLRGDMLSRRSDELQQQLTTAPGGVPPTRARVLRQDGPPVWIEWVGIRLGGSAGRPVDLLMQARDLTAEREARARARLSARRLAIVLEAARDTSFILLDAQARVAEWSRGTELMGRWPPGTLAGQPQDVFFTAEDCAAGIPARLRDEARRLGRAQFEGWRVRRDGSRFWGEVMLYPVPAPHPSRPAGHVQVVRDLTAQRAAAEIMRQAREGLSDLARRLMEQEKLTTQRVAQALHDRLGQILAALRLHAESLHCLPPDRLWAEARARAPAIDLLHAEAMREVRQVLTELRPPLLEELGLVAALDNELRAHPARGTGVDLLLDARDGIRAQRWPASVEYAAFMIAREAITNALQHSGSPVVRVEICGGPASLHLSVADDGGGMRASSAERPGHLGLLGMRERALAIGAQLTIRAIDGEADDPGTEVFLAWPAPATEDDQ